MVERGPGAKGQEGGSGSSSFHPVWSFGKDLPPNAFAMVMATGIVSLAADGGGQPLLARALFWLNVGLYAALWVLLLDRALRHRDRLAADLGNHAKAPGFF